MNERERIHNDPQPPDPALNGVPTTNGASLAASQQTANLYLAAAQSAISQVLSGNSQAFNDALRQRGGQ